MSTNSPHEGLPTSTRQNICNSNKPADAIRATDMGPMHMTSALLKKKSEDLHVYIVYGKSSF